MTSNQVPIDFEDVLTGIHDHYGEQVRQLVTRLATSEAVNRVLTAQVAEAQEQLAATRGELVRSDDLVVELRRQLEALSSKLAAGTDAPDTDTDDGEKSSPADEDPFIPESTPAPAAPRRRRPTGNPE